MKTRMLRFFLFLAAILVACRTAAAVTPTGTDAPAGRLYTPTGTDAPAGRLYTPTATGTPPVNTATATLTSGPLPTETATLTPTETSTPTPVATPTPDPNQGLGELRFEDQLDGSSDWLWGYIEAGVVSFGVDGGSVLAEFEGKNKGYRITLGPDAFTGGDQQAQLTARAETCGGQDEWGLLFRATFTSNNKFNGYVFKLNCAGQARVDRLNNSTSTVLLDWTAAAGAKSGAGGENTLLVWAGKDELRFYVNGSYVGTVKDASFLTGVYGLYAKDLTNGNARFRFTDLRVFNVTASAP